MSIGPSEDGGELVQKDSPMSSNKGRKERIVILGVSMVFCWLEVVDVKGEN